LTLARCAVNGIPLYLKTGKSFQDQRTCIFVTLFFNNTEGFQWNLKKYSIENDYVWNTAVFFIFGKKIHRVWDRSIKEFIISQNLKNKKGKLMATQYISKLKLQKKLFDNNKENKNRSQFSCYASNLRTEHCL